MHKIYAQKYFRPSFPGSFTSLSKFKQVLKEKEGLDTRDLKNWLISQPTYSLYKVRPRKIPWHPVIAFSKGAVWEGDLMQLSDSDSQANDGIRFLAVFIDILSRFCWVLPLKDKSQESIITACTKLFLSQAPAHLRTDRGSEFTSKAFRELCKKIGIFLYHSNDSVKASVSERLIRTLRTKVRRFQEFSGSRRFIHVLNDLVLSYNRTPHRAHNYTPEEALHSIPNSVLFQKTYKVKNLRYDVRFNKRKELYRPGDEVRIIAFKTSPFMKAENYTPYTRETFRISRMKFRYPNYVYYLVDRHGDELIGSFLSEEIQKIK
jgi:hypothetical protein